MSSARRSGSTGSSEAIPELRRQVEDAGVTVESLAETEPGLEEVFVALARGEELLDEEEVHG